MTTTELPGDGATTASELSECLPVDNPTWFSASLGPCADPACADVVVDGFMPEGNKSDAALFTDLALECEVQAGPLMFSEAWVLGDCTGEGAPDGNVQIKLAGDQEAELLLTLGERVRLTIHFGWYYGNEHRSWSLRRVDDSLIAIVSEGLALPPSELVEPLHLLGLPQSCGTIQACGGASGDADLRVTLGETSVRVPHGEASSLATSPTYTVLVPTAHYSGPYGCGVFDWANRYRIAIVLSQ